MTEEQAFYKIDLTLASTLSDAELTQVAEALDNCPNLEPIITPVRAFTLVGLLQLAAQMLEPGTYSATVAREMAESLIYKLAEHSPIIADCCNRGWHNSYGLHMLSYSEAELMEIDLERHEGIEP